MCHRIRQEYEVCAGWYGMVCWRGMYGMVGFGCDMRCDGADGLAGLSTDALFGACAGWVLDIMARLVRRCGMALGCCDCGGCSDLALAWLLAHQAVIIHIAQS